MVASVEEVSSSLVREYLSRKGLKRTIACMDEEHPRTVASISNRSQLRQLLNIEDLYRTNKAQKSPLKTFLEIIVKHHIEQFKNDASPPSESQQSTQALSPNANSAVKTQTWMNAPKTEDIVSAVVVNRQTKLRSDMIGSFLSQSTHSPLLQEKDRLSTSNQTSFCVCGSEEQKYKPLVASLQDNNCLMKREPEKNASVTKTTQRSRTNRIRRGMLAAPIPQELNKKRNGHRVEVSQSLLKTEEESQQLLSGFLDSGFHNTSVGPSLHETSSAACVGGQWGLQRAPESLQSENTFENVGLNTSVTKKVKKKPNVPDLQISEMVLDDLDDDDNDELRELSDLSLQKTFAKHKSARRPVDQYTAVELKTVLFGSNQSCFSVEWRNQGFAFSETHDLRYGIVQRKGGPCGVLASVQAFFLKKLLFETTETSNTGLQVLRPSNTMRRNCLVLAMAEILWRAGEEKQATIAINSGANHFTPSRHFRSEGVFEKMTCFTVDTMEDLRLFLEQHIEQFETGPLGCVLMTISTILSRSIEKIREDMDVPSTTLIGAHGYCTQELVNLLLCGRAVSNVFDTDMEFDSGNGNMTLLKGIKGRCDVGLLSLFEHYNLCKVGMYLKTPLYPIWVVCSESHFSVLFSLQRELLTNEDRGLEFDLYYYDGLANQQEEIRLTVSVGKFHQSGQDVDTDLIPPLELCIRTRWKDAFVSWNDTEPIL
ncbi:putative ubiquitin carboxyl-terminal hydrolase MINDY-4 [Pholidichthys leucotaenia]